MEKGCVADGFMGEFLIHQEFYKLETKQTDLFCDALLLWMWTHRQLNILSLKTRMFFFKLLKVENMHQIYASQCNIFNELKAYYFITVPHDGNTLQLIQNATKVS